MKQEYIENLIGAVDYFKKNDGKNEFENLSFSDIRSLVILTLQSFPQILPEYEFYTEDDFNKINLDQFEDQLNRIRTYLITENGNIPDNLEILVEDFEKNHEEVAGNKKGAAHDIVRAEIDKRMQLFHERSKYINDITKILQTEDASLTETAINEVVLQLEKIAGLAAIAVILSNNQSREALISDIKENPDSFKKKLLGDFPNQETVINTYIESVVNLPTDSEVIPVLSDIGENRLLMQPLPVNISTSEVPKTVFGKYSDVFNGILKTVVEQKKQSPTEALVVDFKNIPPEIREDARKVITQIAGEEFAGKLLLKEKKSEEYAYQEISVSSFWAGPIGVPLLKTIEKVAAPSEIKKDPFKLSMELYYQLGVTAGQFETIASSVGLKKEQTEKFLKAFKEYHIVHPFMAIEAGLSPTQTQRLMSVFQKPTGEVYDEVQWFENYQTDFPVSGVRGLALRVSQQIFGNTAKNIFNGLVENGLKRAAVPFIKAGVKELAAAAGTAIAPGIGTALAWLGTTILPWIKRGLPIIFGGFGALIGGVTLGGVGIIIGFSGGFAIGGGITGGSVAAGIETISGGVAALGGAFTSALLAPLVIAVIGIPTAVALILFIINSGAYVVPYATKSAGSGNQSAIYPAVSCFVFKGDWSTRRRTVATDSINFLLNNVPSYINPLCTAFGTITLNSTTLGGEWGNASPAGGQIDFDLAAGGGAFLNLPDGVYLLAHELGHKYAYGYGRIYAKFKDTPAFQDPDKPKTGILICTYPISISAIYNYSESFAESIADYISNSPMSPGAPPFAGHYGCLSGTTFQQKYPNHWRFVHENIIQEQMGWPGT